MGCLGCTPDRLRVEFVVKGKNVIAVFVGESWWSWEPSRGGLTNNGHPSSRHGKGPGELLIDPSGIASALELDLLETTSSLGRPVSIVSGTPTQGAAEDWERSAVLHTLGPGADQYELMVDDTSGVLLRLEARYLGAPFRVVEITELKVDEPLDDGMSVGAAGGRRVS